MKAETREKLEKITEEIRKESKDSANTPLWDVIHKFCRIFNLTQSIDAVLEEDKMQDKTPTENTVKG